MSSSLVFERVHVIYDGQCAFCIRSLRLFRAMDVKQVFEFHDAHQEQRIATLFPELKAADFDNAMFVVTERGDVYRGFFAFRRMIWGSPWAWWMIPVFYFPGASFLGVRIYAWVARNRLKLGCRSDSCSLPTLVKNSSPRVSAPPKASDR